MLLYFVSYFEPRVNDVLHGHEFVCPCASLFLERNDERRTQHSLRFDDVVVEQHLNVVDGRQNVDALQKQAVIVLLYMSNIELDV